MIWCTPRFWRDKHRQEAFTEEAKNAERARRAEVHKHSRQRAGRIRQVINQRKSFYVPNSDTIARSHVDMLIEAATRNGFYVVADPLWSRRVFIVYGDDERSAVLWTDLEPKVAGYNTEPTTNPSKEYKPAHGGYPG